MCKYFTITLSIVSWISFNFGCLQPGRGQETVGRKYAILVGVKEYDRNQLKNLPFAENDVSEMAEILKQSGFRRVELLTQAEGAKKSRFLPLAKTIRETIAGVLEDREKDDLVLIAFAGHGVQFKNEKENYFCPMDAVLTDRSTLISLTDVYKQLEQSKAGAKLLLVDACRNDPLAGNARAAGEVTLQSLTRPHLPDPPGGVAAFFSCSAGQRAFEDESLKHGVFFHYVIQGLKGEAKIKKRDVVTWDSLIAYVKSEVPDTVITLYGHTTRQIPESKGELRGETSLITFNSERTPTNKQPRTPSVPPTATNSTSQVFADDRSFEGESTGVANALVPGIKFHWCPPTSEPFQMGTSKQIKDGQRGFRTGSIRFGAEDGDVTVTLTQGFWLGETEVTQGQWKKVMKSEPWKGEKNVRLGDSFPATYVTHGKSGNAETDSACLFCVRLTDQEHEAGRLPVNWEYRLPTEAQWEYACRAGTTTKYSFGDDPTRLIDNGVSNASPPRRGGGGFDSPGPVNGKAGPENVRSKKKPNPWGFYDMHGNVYEWCADISGPLPGGEDPDVQNGYGSRIIRGGSWASNADACRSAKREHFGGMIDGVSDLSQIGFRIAAIRVKTR